MLLILFSGKSNKPFRITKQGEGVDEFNQVLNLNNHHFQNVDLQGQNQNILNDINSGNVDIDN